jgi:hypothetical protein
MKSLEGDTSSLGDIDELLELSRVAMETIKVPCDNGPDPSRRDVSKKTTVGGSRRPSVGTEVVVDVDLGHVPPFCSTEGAAILLLPPYAGAQTRRVATDAAVDCGFHYGG